MLFSFLRYMLLNLSIYSILIFLLLRLLQHFVSKLLEQINGLFIHRCKLSDFSGNHRRYIINGNPVLLLFLQCVPHGLEHSGSHKFSRLFAVVNVFLNIPQDSEEYIFDFLNLRFMEALQKPPCQAGWNKNVLFGFS